MTTGAHAVSVAVAADADVGEGPVFDPRTDALCWVDLTAGRLFESDLATGATRTRSYGTMIGAAVPRRDAPGFAVATAEGFGIADGDVLEIVDPVLAAPDLRMNDAKCDALGRLWAGSTALDFAPDRGALHRWDGEAPSTVMRTGFALPNGIGWNAESTTMYLVDSMAGVLLHADFDLASGDVGEFRTLARIDEGLPDGLAVDVEGAIWVAVWGGWGIRRYSPQGALLETVALPVAQPSSCAFAPDGTLYVTSARSGLGPEALAGQPAAGSVFAVPTPTRGAPVATFAA